MAKIIYGINSEGLGHATRSIPVINYLMKKHDLVIVSGGKPYEFLSQIYKNIFKTKGFTAVYEKNRISLFKSLQTNLTRSDTPSFFKNLSVLFKGFNPDIVICDLEPMSSFFSRLRNLPLINIDNQGLYIVGKLKVAPKDSFDFQKTKNLVKTWVPRADYFFICSFFPVEIKKRFLKNKKARVIKPILRDDILKLEKKREKNYIFVYQTHDNNEELVNILSQVKYKFHAYKLPRTRHVRNINFKQLNKNSLKDLAHARAVITNGGFTLISEALFLKKPVLSIPIRGIYEQKLNGLKVQEMGFGEYHKNITPEIIENFIKKIPEYKENLAGYKGSGNSDLFQELDEMIPRLIQEKKEKKERIRRFFKRLFFIK
ncbi:MAG: hypothetical protein JW827_05570 [Spirochaetes bacterium]|nr:hypothetical protein [Spirochaetota bacterium]